MFECQELGFLISIELWGKLVSFKDNINFCMAEQKFVLLVYLNFDEIPSRWRSNLVFSIPGGK